MVRARRALSFAFCIFVAAVAAKLAADMALTEGAYWPDVFRILFLTLNTAWIAWGVAVAFNGLLSVPRHAPTVDGSDLSDVKTAILVPVYNEDPVKTFSNVAAMAQSLSSVSANRMFDFVILSDTNDALVARREEFWFARFRAECAGEIDVYYRRRPENIGKKAGNIADFIRTSGAVYDYLAILDADSLMDGATLVEMVRRMQAEPRLGLLQSLPAIVHARTLFGRAIQFSAAYFSPVHARGLAELQGGEGLFWGHNAIVRTRAFAQSCGLPRLSGNPPFGGHVLSHDFVEAALLARNGWLVRLDPDLAASYEEGPENILDYAKRDRRWCQGNLQHARLLAAPGFRPWSRFFFLQGIMAYLASPFWALFLLATILTHMMANAPNYFSPAGLPVFPSTENLQALALLTGVMGLLIGPKLVCVLVGALDGSNRAFGGTGRVAASVLVEIALSTLLAPVMLLYQTRSVAQVLFGIDGGWPATDRSADSIAAGAAWRASWWICVAGAMALSATWWLAPDILGWIALVTVPAILSPLIVRLTSMPSTGALAGRLGVLRTPGEIAPSPVVRIQEAVYSSWRTDAAGAPRTTSRAAIPES